jgi:SAM-dependent methyltransferase
MGWRAHLQEGDIAIDATCGNGYDTLFLSQLDPCGMVVALDIQDEALQRTKALLSRVLPQERLARILLRCQCHTALSEVPLPKPPRLIVYNLGYLPGGNKGIVTRAETSVASLRAALSLLAPDGAISMVCYPGHPEGEREEKAILAFLQTLAVEVWSVSYQRQILSPTAPSLFWISKRASSMR